MRFPPNLLAVGLQQVETYAPLRTCICMRRLAKRLARSKACRGNYAIHGRNSETRYTATGTAKYFSR